MARTKKNAPNRQEMSEQLFRHIKKILVMSYNIFIFFCLTNLIQILICNKYKKTFSIFDIRLVYVAHK